MNKTIYQHYASTEAAFRRDKFKLVYPQTEVYTLQSWTQRNQYLKATFGVSSLARRIQTWWI